VDGKGRLLVIGGGVVKVSLGRVDGLDIDLSAVNSKDGFANARTDQQKTKSIAT
jgi:hypothetical protein